mmetsp:Transcript_27635/g.60978  ORF Transcript_27635/g.60978 Transcript_27635/m.60978 type:complete len:763 (-) Transcript_27635:184-2472(-)
MDDSSAFQDAVSTRQEAIRRIKNIVDQATADFERGTKKSSSTDDDFDDTLVPAASSASALTVVLNDETTFLRKLFVEERETLKNDCGCTSSTNNWSNIYLLLPASDEKPDLSTELKPLVSSTHFDGFVVLDLTTESKENEKSDKDDDNEDDEEHKSDASVDWTDRLPPGLHSNSCVIDSIVHLRSSRVYRNSFVAKTYVGPRSVLLNCACVTASETAAHNDNFGTIDITVGAESGGGRSLSLTAESTMIDVCRLLHHRDESNSKAKTKGASATDAMVITPFGFNVLLGGALVRDTPTVENVFLYPGSKIEVASSVKKATLFPDAKITNGSVVENALMQWNASISDNAKTTDVLLMEHSHFGPSGVIESTVLGPDSHASCGEIHASVVGPNTNSRHQSLVIGTLWPMGRGNVAYGANVGSNHTGRLPDQECTSGEGIFWGLGCVVKFPVDLTSAPYTMIAAGTKLIPQRITMPFSLVVEVSDENGSSVNDIVPGWVAEHSPYTLARNDKKYTNRRKATRHSFYTGWKIFRPSTVENCRLARAALRKPGDSDAALLEEVPGIGKCRLTERARNDGIKAYDNCIQLYALRGLLTFLNSTFPKSDPPASNEDENNEDAAGEEEDDGDEALHEIGSLNDDGGDDSSLPVEWPYCPWEVSQDSSWDKEWEYQRKLLVEEFPNSEDNGTVYDVARIQTMLNKLVGLEKDFVERVAKSKGRDDVRGASIVPGYDKSHASAEMDPVVTEARRSLKTMEETVERVLTKMASL